MLKAADAGDDEISFFLPRSKVEQLDKYDDTFALQDRPMCLKEDYHLDVMGYLFRAFALFRSEPVAYMMLSLPSVVLFALPLVAPLGLALLLHALLSPLDIALYTFALAHVRNEHNPLALVQVVDMIRSNPTLVLRAICLRLAAIALGVLADAFLLIGPTFFMVVLRLSPALYALIVSALCLVAAGAIAVQLMYAPVLLADRPSLQVMDLMRLSSKAVKGRTLANAVVFTSATVIAMLGALVLLVGVIATGPIGALVVVQAYADIYSDEPDTIGSEVA